MCCDGGAVAGAARGLVHPSWLTCVVILTVVLVAPRRGRCGEMRQVRGPVAIALQTSAGRELRGVIVAYDGGGFQLRRHGVGAGGATERVPWTELSARDVFAVHERLLGNGTAADWRQAARALGVMKGGKPYAETASRLAAELAAPVERDAPEGERRPATSRSRGPLPPSLGGAPMVSVLSRAQAGRKARRLARSLRRRWERVEAGQSPSAGLRDTERGQWRVELDKAVQVRVESGRASVVGAVSWYGQDGFGLGPPGAASRVVRWRDLEPAGALALLGQLLAGGTGREWLRAARLLAAQPEGRLVANAALRLALERDASFGDLPDFDRVHLHAYVADRCGEAIGCPDLGADAGPHWRRTREQVEKAGSNRKLLYRVVGEHLLLADRYLAHQARAVRLDAMGYAHDATYIAIRRLRDPLLGLAIADVFLLPHLDAAERLYTKPLSRQSIVNTAVAACHAAGDFPRLVHALERLLAIAHNRNAADAARYRLGHVLAHQGDYEAALRHLEQIDLSPQGFSGPRALMDAVRRKLAEPQATKRRAAP